MNLLIRLFCISIFSIFLVGCSTKTPEPIIRTEYVEVKVPVKIKLYRPDRPKYSSSDTTPTYLLKLIEYTSRLEIIIDEYNEE